MLILWETGRGWMLLRAVGFFVIVRCDIREQLHQLQRTILENPTVPFMKPIDTVRKLEVRRYTFCISISDERVGSDKGS